jgi:hypothetical protein
LGHFAFREIVFGRYLGIQNNSHYANEPSAVDGENHRGSIIQHHPDGGFLFLLVASSGEFKAIITQTNGKHVSLRVRLTSPEVEAKWEFAEI